MGTNTEHGPAAASVGRLADHVPAEALMVKLRQLQDEVVPNSALQTLFGVSPMHADHRSWYWGSRGERIVAERLARLDPSWTVLHSVPVGKKDSDIDHVLVGPCGVVVINTKDHSTQRVWVGGSTFMVNGHRQHHVRNSRHERDRAAKALRSAVGFDVPVLAAVVVVAPRSMTVKEQPDGVVVLTDGQLVRWLRKRPAVLSPEQVSTVAAAAGEASSWTGRALPDHDRAELVTWFERLDRDVRSAQRVRALWRFAGGLVGLGGVLYLVPPLLERVLASLVP